MKIYGSNFATDGSIIPQAMFKQLREAGRVQEIETAKPRAASERASRAVSTSDPFYYGINHRFEHEQRQRESQV